MLPATAFGSRLKSLRRALGVSQEELASRCQRSVEAISNIERGLNYPSFELLMTIASVLGVRPGLLLDDEHADDRAALIAKIASHAAALDDGDLEIAARQIEVLASRGK